MMSLRLCRIDSLPLLAAEVMKGDYLLVIGLLASMMLHL